MWTPLTRLPAKQTAVARVGRPTEEFAKFLSYSRHLKFEEQPDYDYLTKLFNNVMKKQHLTNDQVYDWMLLDGRVRTRCRCAPHATRAVAQRQKVPYLIMPMSCARRAVRGRVDVGANLLALFVIDPTAECGWKRRAGRGCGWPGAGRKRRRGRRHGRRPTRNQSRTGRCPRRCHPGSSRSGPCG